MSEDLTNNLARNDADKLNTVVGAVQELTFKVKTLDQKVMERLHDTRPMWEQMVTDVGELKEGQQRLQQSNLQLQQGQQRLEQNYLQLQEGQQRLEQNYLQLQEGQQRLEQNYLQLQEGQQRLEQNYLQLQEGQQRLEQNYLQLQEGQQRLEQNYLQLQEGQQRLEQAFETLRHDSREIKTFLRDILRRMSIFNDTLVTMQADYRDIYDRVRCLELKSN